MTDNDDRDLARAFEELRAPASTARYAERAERPTRVHEVGGSGRQWRQALAGGLAVVVAVGAAATFLALRSSRQADNAAGSAGTPPARAQAAMAFDSTAGVTVMYGGYTTLGGPLADTWTWNGSSWISLGGSPPGVLAGARMVDDPADGGVLLIGLPYTPSSGGGGVACASGGSSGPGSSSTGSSGGASGSGSAPGATPVAGNASSSSSDTTATAATPAVAPRPSPTGSGPATTITGPALPVPAPSDCAVTTTPPVPAPGLQTWLFTAANGWTKLADATGATGNDIPSLEAQMAFDPATQAVVAVTSGGYACGIASSAPGVATKVCPAMGAASNAGTAPSQGSASSTAGSPTIGMCAPNTNCGMPCPLAGAINSCGQGSTVTTWTWSRGSWHHQADITTGALAAWGTSVAIVEDSASGKATLIAQTQPMACPASDAACSPAPFAHDYWTWNGTAWEVHTGAVAPAALTLGGATMVEAGGRVLAIWPDGSAWHWDSGTWQRVAPVSGPSARFGSAVAAGPGKTVVLFGGIAVNNGAYAYMSSLGQPGSDTWVLSGSAWHRAGGTAPPLPSPLPGASCPPGAKLECMPVPPQPANVSPQSVPGSTPVPGGAPQTSPPASPSPVAKPSPSGG